MKVTISPFLLKPLQLSWWHVVQCTTGGDTGCRYTTCADPESFVWGGQLFSWWGEEGSKYHYQRSIIGPPAKRHLNGVSLACRCWPNLECWLDSFVIFRGSGPVLLLDTLYFCDFLDGESDPQSPMYQSGLYATISSCYIQNARERERERERKRERESKRLTCMLVTSTIFLKSVWMFCWPTLLIP